MCTKHSARNGFHFHLSIPLNEDGSFKFNLDSLLRSCCDLHSVLAKPIYPLCLVVGKYSDILVVLAIQNSNDNMAFHRTQWHLF
jgi:hypothetical protein